jgi:hypothetical protein
MAAFALVAPPTSKQTIATTEIASQDRILGRIKTPTLKGKSDRGPTRCPEKRNSGEIALR